MPPQTRGIKALKENATLTAKKKDKNNVKKNRKPLADKTNSASDDNNSGLISIKENGNNVKKTPDSTKERSRRNRRLPTRYEENNILKNLSNFSPLSPKSLTSPLHIQPNVLPNKISVTNLTPHKTPSRMSKTPLISKRPKRVCRLPSKLDTQFLSPTKNTAIQPSHASTPIANKSKKKVNEVKNDKPQTKVQNIKNNEKEDNITDTKRTRSRATSLKSTTKIRSPLKIDKSLVAKKAKVIVKKNVNINEKEGECLEQTKNDLDTHVKLGVLKTTKATKNTFTGKNNPENNNTLKLLDNRNNSLKRDSSKLDVYEFTFDPTEEPPPQKKKKKRNPRNPNAPKKVVKSMYDKNLEKALASLKKTFAFKNNVVQDDKPIAKQAPSKSDKTDTRKSIPETSSSNALNADVNKTGDSKYNSIRIEDIAMQFQDNTHHDSIEINYSPVNSPLHALSPVYETNEVVENPVLSTSKNSNVHSKTPDGLISNRDPLNLQDHVSFFDDEPVASSSMNISTRHPTASPWRVEFNNLPIKWQVNSYVKPNMTPAIESSFINYNDSQKKHVYTNIMTESNESIPQVEENPISHTSNLKQTSILSFIKEVVEKKANKNKKPMNIQTNSLFEDTHVQRTTSRKDKNCPEVIVEKSNTSGEEVQSDSSGVKDSLLGTDKTINAEKQCEKDKNNDITYFGFDEIEDQENVSPVKVKTKKRKTKTRKALQAINGKINKLERIPMPLAPMSKPARIPNQMNKILDGAKTATEPPVFPEQHNEKNTQVTSVNTDTMQSNIDEDGNSVHLFEDIELVHHLKPTRKSYGKSKKVTFYQSAVNNYESDNENKGSSDEDNLDDLSFKLPSEKEKKPAKKKPTKKQKLSKKEEKEAEEWAAGFNSMCEDIDEFDLVVE